MSEKKSVLHKIRENPWILSSVILGIILTIFIINNSFGGVSGNSTGQKLVDFLNKQAPSKITLEDVSTESGLYKVNVLFQDQSIPVYATKDGKYFIQSLIPIEDSSDSLDNSNSNTGAEESATETEYVNVSADDDAVKGDSNAPVTIIEFSDYECPFCGRHFQQTLPQIISEYVDTGKVKIVFRDFPLGFHTKAQKAAEAAECAGDIGGDKKYWEMHDKLFSNQASLDVDSLKKSAVEIGLNSVKFNDCLDSGKMASEVEKDLNDGQKYGVSGTPANFINGRLVSGALPFSEFKKLIDEELAKTA